MYNLVLDMVHRFTTEAFGSSRLGERVKRVKPLHSSSHPQSQNTHHGGGPRVDSHDSHVWRAWWLVLVCIAAVRFGSCQREAGSSSLLLNLCFHHHYIVSFQCKSHSPRKNSRPDRWQLAQSKR